MQLLDNNPIETPSPLLLDVSGITLRLTHAEFDRLCINNPERSLELTKGGELEVLSLVGGVTGNQLAEIGTDLSIWNKKTGLGVVFSSSCLFFLPNGAGRSPDVSWLHLSRWQSLTTEQREGFPPLAPDFAIELRSPTDRLSKLQAKMLEYRDNGVRLGWLINPQQKQVEIYRLDKEVEVLEEPQNLSGEDVLPGFILELNTIFRD